MSGRHCGWGKNERLGDCQCDERSDMSTIYFAHGKESGQWERRIASLADVAQSKGFEVESPDYSGFTDPDARVMRLLGV